MVVAISLNIAPYITKRQRLRLQQTTKRRQQNRGTDETAIGFEQHIDTGTQSFTYVYGVQWQWQ